MKEQLEKLLELKSQLLSEQTELTRKVTELNVQMDMLEKEIQAVGFESVIVAQEYFDKNGERVKAMILNYLQNLETEVASLGFAKRNSNEGSSE